MSVEAYLAFVLATVALAALPGPIVSLIVANGTSYGTRAAFTTIAGSSTGLALMVTGAAFGMGSLLSIMADWFDYIRWAGAAYLVWLGVSRFWLAWRDGPQDSSIPAGGRHWYWQGLMAALSNPKVLLFLGAFLPQFVNHDATAGPQLLLLAVTFVITAASIDSLYALAAGSARTWFTGRRMRKIGRAHV